MIYRIDHRSFEEKLKTRTEKKEKGVSNWGPFTTLRQPPFEENLFE